MVDKIVSNDRGVPFVSEKKNDERSEVRFGCGVVRIVFNRYEI